MLFLPELILLLGTLCLFLVSLGSPAIDTLRKLTVIIMALVMLASLACLNQKGSLFFDSYQVDFFSQLFKFLICTATLVVLIFSEDAPGIRSDVKAEYYVFLFTGVLGLMMLTSSVELLAILVSLELSSFALYIMVPMRSAESGGAMQMESGIKYLLFGVMSTGFMLFGMSYIFGLCGSTYLSDIAVQIEPLFYQPAAIIAIALMLAGFFYKLAIFPFHFWVPDVYQGAANETTAFIAAVPKIAAVAVMIRIVSLVSAEGQTVVNLLLICAIGSMFYGNLSALVQKDFKRMLGFSGISHAGFVLFGLLTLSSQGYATSLYYIIGYAAMNLACFLVVCTVAPSGKNLAIEDFTGLHQRSPLLAVILAIGLFALAGIPPFVGFTGKFMLLVSAFKQGHVLAVVLAAINTAIAIYYYLSVVRVAYCSDPEGATMQVAPGTLTTAVSLLLLLVIVAMGILPGAFLNLTSTAIGTIL
ncbi:MAG: NADH-quinone oxidoreductase subunit N [Desulfofustis sp.]|nr:NADH-quinone oxidoreductase subunit N [Desulfofustis sp.]